MAAMGWPWLGAMGGAALFAGVTGVALYFALIRPIAGRGGHLMPLVITTSAAALMEAAVQAVFGVDLQRFPPGTVPEQVWHVGGMVVTSVEVILVTAAVLLMLSLGYLVRRTRLGKAIRAVSISPQIAAMLGIDPQRINAAVFFIASALGGMAGVLIALFTNAVVPEMGRAVELKGLAIITIGGLNNIPGAFVAALGLGVTEALVSGYLSSGWKEAIVFAFLILVLLLRPQGLFGAAAGRKA